MTTVLVAGVGPGERRHTTAALRAGGYGVETAGSLRQAASKLRHRQVHALVVDPGADDAAEVVAALRARTDVPIIVVSERADDFATVAALDAGADDYLTKPFSVDELLARLRASLRRVLRPTDTPPVTTADFTIHLEDRRWRRADGQEVRLTPTQWKLIEMLVRRSGHLVRQTDLLTGVWGPEAANETNYLRVHMTAIRKKVEPEPSRPRYFITVPGLGLRFQPEGRAMMGTAEEASRA